MLTSWHIRNNVCYELHTSGKEILKFFGINFKSSSNGLVRKLRSWNRYRLVKKRSIESQTAEEPDTLCVLGILKNEELAIDEWIQHYLWQGVDKIILIDNGSTDSSPERIKSWAQDKRISYISLARPYRQREHYWSAIKRFGVREKWKWLLIADLDEFWFSKDGKPLKERLADYKDMDVVYYNWSIFGCQDKIKHPKSLRRSLLFRNPILGSNKHKKYLVRAKKLRNPSMLHIHYVAGLDSADTISDNTNLQINHYVTQSYHFWTKVKMTRGDVIDPLADNLRELRTFESVNSTATQKDTLLSELVDRQI